jgi:hypothetical protein
VRELGWSPSKIVKEALRILESSYLQKEERGVIGLGTFSSGIAGLASDKKHLRNFGR